MASSRLKQSRLTGSKLLGDDDRIEEPSSSLGNLMDAMLVFACGLMLALIVHWNVDITQTQGGDSSSSGDQATELDGTLSKSGDEIAANGDGYENLGSVYRDKKTGKLYIVGK